MGDFSDAPSKLSQSAIVRRRRRPRKTFQHDIESMYIEDFAQKEMTRPPTALILDMTSFHMQSSKVGSASFVSSC